jgi:hypothetical protein
MQRRLNDCRTISARRRWRSEDRLLVFGEIHTRRVEIRLQRTRMPCRGMGTQKVQADGGRQLLHPPHRQRPPTLGSIRSKTRREAHPRFSCDVEHFPAQNNELPDAFSRQPGDDVFVEDPAVVEVFLTPERIDPEVREFLAFLTAAELHRRILEAQTTDSQLQDEKRQQPFNQLWED